jgi:hypothetical protein
MKKWVVLFFLFLLGNLFVQPLEAGINSVSFTSPVFRPTEVTPVQATQAEIRILMDASMGQYRLSAFKAVSNILVKQRLVTHNLDGGTPLEHTISVPLDEGENSFHIIIQDVTLASSTASFTTPDTPFITRDMRTKVYSVTLDGISPYERTIQSSIVDLNFTINGTASEYNVEVLNFGTVVTAFTTGTGTGLFNGVAANEGINVYSLNVVANDTFSLPEVVSSNYVTIVRDSIIPVINNLAVAFPILPTEDAVVSLQGDTDPFALVRVRTGAGVTYFERANALGFFSLLGLDLPLNPPGTTTSTFLVDASDYGKNSALTVTVTADRDEGDPRFNFIQLFPGDGFHMTPDEPVHIQGSVGDIAGPYQVKFYARSGSGFPALEETISSLNPFTAFEKDIALIADPVQPNVDQVYSIEAEVISTNGVSGRHFLGEVTLDVADPPPVNFSDVRLDDVLHTNASMISIEGEAERFSSVWFSQWHDVVYQPSSKLYSQATNAALGGEFRQTLNLTALPEKQFSLEVTVVATSTRSGEGSKREIIIDRDTEAPTVTAVTIDGEPEATGRQHYYKAGALLTIVVTMSELMVTNPELYVTERGSEALPAALTAVITPGRVYEYIYVIQNSNDFNGSIDIVISGGLDRAGNTITGDYRVTGLAVTDTLSPVINPLGTIPVDGKEVSLRPYPIRVNLQEHGDSVEPSSGINIVASTLQVLGPFETDPSQINTGTITRFAPSILEFRFDNGQGDKEGTYNILITAVDNAGNSTSQSVIYILDKTSISELFIEDVVPVEGSNLNELTWPQNITNDQYVSVSFTGAVTPELDINASRLSLYNFMPVPGLVKGVKTSSGPGTLFYTFDENFRTDGSDDGVYTIQIEPVDHAGNVAPAKSVNVVYDTVEPFVMDGFNHIDLYNLEPLNTLFPADKSTIRGPLKLVSAEIVDGVSPNGREFTGSGVGTSLTSGSDIELVLLERHPLTSIIEGTSTTNIISGALKFASVQPPVYSPAWGGIKRATVVRELFTTGPIGVPEGLPVDGSYDGEWQIKVTPVDMAGNKGEMRTGRFTYDTVPPELFLFVITNDEMVAGNTLVTSGTCSDNNKTTHDEGQGISRVILRLEAVDSWGLTVVPPLIDWTDLELPQNLKLLPAEATIRWNFEQRIPAYDGKGRLLVKAIDLAGNETLVVRDLQIQSDILSAPVLRAPANESPIPATIVNFSWAMVNGASDYRVTLTDPAGNHVVRTVSFPYDNVNINLSTQPEGRWTWYVEAIDTQGTAGEKSRAWAFYVDRTKPQILSIFPFDGTVPSAQSGTLFNGQVRVGVTFSETMNVTTSPVVVFQPADPTIPASEVVQLSYINTEWRGLVDIPPSPDSPDFNGLGTVFVSNAFDLAGNKAYEVSSTLEVDIGPWFEVRAFASPINKREITFIVRCHEKDGGALERLLAPPNMEVKQLNAPKQIVQLTTFQASVYRGVYTVNQNYPGDATILLTGTDLQGNRTSRIIRFSIANIVAADRFTVSFGSLTMNLSENSLKADNSILLMPSDLRDTSKDKEDGLTIIHRFNSLPQGPLELIKAGTITCSLTTLYNRGLEYSKGSIGLFVLKGDSYIYLPGVINDGQITAATNVFGDFVLGEDLVPPVLTFRNIENGLVSVDESRGKVVVEVLDTGAGIKADSLKATVDGIDAPLTYRAAEGIVEISLPPELNEGSHLVSFEASDFFLNRSSLESSMAVPDDMDFLSFISAPNPSRGPVTFRWNITSGAVNGNIKIYDVSSHRIRTISLGPLSAGASTYLWDGTDSRGRTIANGVYIARVAFTDASGHISRGTTKVVLLR